MGLEIDIAWLTVLMFGRLAVLLVLGLPMAFCTGSLAMIFLFVFGTSAMLNMLPSRIFPFMTDYQLSAVPLFIFMAAMLEKAGIIEELFDAIYKWLGALKGGLASATVLACTALAAMVGVVGATEVTMGMIALPAMLRARLRPEARLRLAARRRHARHPDPALGHGDRLCGRGAAVAWASCWSARYFPGSCCRASTSPTSRSAATSTPTLGPALPLEERVDFARS